MDITERREMERRLHQQQEFARRLVDSFPDLILVLDISANYTFVSRVRRDSRLRAWGNRPPSISGIAPIPKILPPSMRCTATSWLAARRSHPWKFACAISSVNGAGFVSISSPLWMLRGRTKVWFFPVAMLPT